MQKRVNREVKLHGYHACLAVWKNRPQDIVRLYVVERRVKQFGEILRWAAKQKLAYHIVSDEELEKVAATQKHQGICLLVKVRAALPFEMWVNSEPKKRLGILGLYLDGVTNPHNIGAVLRISAHFGVKNVFIDSQAVGLESAALTRVAEGGAEHVNIITVSKFKDFYEYMVREGCNFLVSAASAPQSLFNYPLKRSTIFILGAESTGLSDEVIKLLGNSVVSIPGTGVVESLNIASAAAVFCAEYYRQFS